MCLLCRSCTPKQIDLQAILLLQLPYCVSMLLLTSGCKSDTNAIIILGMGKTVREAGVGVGDQWVKPGDGNWEVT